MSTKASKQPDGSPCTLLPGTDLRANKSEANAELHIFCSVILGDDATFLLVPDGFFFVVVAPFFIVAVFFFVIVFECDSRIASVVIFLGGISSDNGERTN